EVLLLPNDRSIVAVGRLPGGRWRIRADHGTIRELLEAVGETPIPPYLRRPPEAADRERYQTIYAAKPGAVAAPTAGLHFTERVFRALDDRGVRRATVTLHVGPGTFRPIESDEIEGHRMEAEHAIVPPATIAALKAARADVRRVIPVGTTAVRTLESLPDPLPDSFEGPTSLFIRPPFPFRWTDGLVTNFHLPGSTLVVLVSALAGRERILAAYEEAKKEGYRFFSYGDAMLIL
ncbi:MAG: tRNA preQ1(34) S-adenosylmethionine ribosyltransferase-isomerase QueA, partial [Planctomycetota bacterium]